MEHLHLQEQITVLLCLARIYLFLEVLFCWLKFITRLGWKETIEWHSLSWHKFDLVILIWLQTQWLGQLWMLLEICQNLELECLSLLQRIIFIYLVVQVHLQCVSMIYMLIFSILILFQIFDPNGKKWVPIVSDSAIIEKEDSDECFFFKYE